MKNYQVYLILANLYLGLSIVSVGTKGLILLIIGWSWLIASIIFLFLKDKAV